MKNIVKTLSGIPWNINPTVRYTSTEVRTDGPKIAVIIQQYVIIDFLLLQTFIIKMLILAQKNQASMQIIKN